MDRDQQGDKEKKKQTLQQTKKCFMADYLMSMVKPMDHKGWLSILLTTLMGRYKTKLK
jgi:hypothetical protein